MAAAYLVVVPDGDPVPVTADSLVVEAGALLVTQTAIADTVGQQAIFAAGQWCHVLVAPPEPDPVVPEPEPSPPEVQPTPEPDPTPDQSTGE